MSETGVRHVYGPVPSRRLGRSLGIDPVPFKVCSYDCVYCQLGRTTNKTLERKEYVPIAEILEELQSKLAAGDDPDYITLAGSGEPTLNSGLGELIAGIKALTRIPVAVLTNGSLLWMREVRDALAQADLVIPSLDGGEERLFRRVNRPHAEISFDRMTGGLEEFARCFSGAVWLEVFLLAGVSDEPVEIEKIAAIAKKIAPARIQLNTVSRPPAEPSARPLSTDQMRALACLFPGRVDIVQAEEVGRRLIPAVNPDPDGEILAILRRHPCTSRDVAVSLGIHTVEALKRLDGLTDAGKIQSVVLGDKVFYVVVDMEKGETA